MSYTDIHCHLAWNVDDGIPTREDAAKALQMAAEDQIKTIVSTPHLYPGYTDQEKFIEINQRIDDLQVLAEEYGIRIVRGCEFHINDEAINWLNQGIYNKIGNTRYMLCEFNPRVDISEVPYADDMLYEFLVKGIIPVIAHAERYFYRIDCDRIEKWINMGCYIQVNRTSIMGYQGKAAEKNALELVKKGLCHVVATDAHRASGTRIMKLCDAYERVTELAGTGNADLLFKKNPALLLEDSDLEDMHMVKQGLFSRLRGKYRP